MRRLLAALAAAIALAVPATASADTTVTGADLRMPYERWIERSLMPTPDVTVEVIERPCPAYDEPVSCAYPDGPIYMALGTPDMGNRLTFAHELGHVDDAEILADRQRARYMRDEGLSGPWLNPEIDHLSPNERFATRVALCSVQKYAVHVPADDARTCRWIAKAIASA